MPDAHAFEQVIVANVDQVVPVFAAANPAPAWHMLDRYLVACESRELPAVIVINKIDLALDVTGALDEDTTAAIDEYRRIGYPVIPVSAVTGEGLPALKSALEGRVSVLVGKSGVGKSSLLNALQPGLGLKVNEVSKGNGRGRHTTSHMEMFPLEFEGGGAIVDTPGTREFGLWNIDPDTLEECFPEMRPFLGRCRFKLGCRHDEEPGCAIRKAVSEGTISDRRYFSFMKLRVDP
jgi:ribosome biogenesis GTPase